ncbi:hypothetical protein F5144DRAFT_618823 [Chaetomium tenue]|uniref:Uncharacterized protein n=1 Tax=Chaetomium tenue TaxID=1854479 RepID=A0ACB7PLJ5_9PEZI|nr:hypothetical protein F5144DRAFT_618823 [Chaetomium globosum]
MAGITSHTHDELPDSLLAEHEAERPRKKVRKGTRSCWECKRRKVRCVFAAPEDTICNPCKRRGMACVSQELPDVPQPAIPSINSNQVELHDRLGRMEALVKTLVEQMTRDTVNGPPELPLTPTTSITWASDRRVAASTKLGDLSQRLAEAWPSQRELDYLLRDQTESSESLVLKASGMPYAGSASVRDILRIPPPGSHPVLVARKLLLLGIFLQGTMAGTSPGNAASCCNLMARAIEAARLVTGNDELANSIEGIECIMMESLYHDLTGNLRRAWVAIRRAIAMAQMMGLHRGTDVDTRSPEISGPESRAFIDPQNLWLRLLQADRYTSLMLDLPQSSLDDVFASPVALEHCTSLDKMRRLDCLAAGRILQRTPADINNYTTTREIDALLQTAAAAMPPQWWLTPDFLSSSLTNPSTPTTAITTGTILMDQFVHFHLVARLHLPYLLHPPITTTTTTTTTTTLQQHDHTYSHLTTTSATREMLTRFLAFRALSPTAPYCRGMDFFAFIASATLCVAHIEGWQQRRRRCDREHASDDAGGGGVNYQLLAHHRMSDRGLVERALGCFRRLVGVGYGGGGDGDGDVVAVEGMVDVLGRLLGMEEDAAGGGGVYRVRSWPAAAGGATGGGGRAGLGVGEGERMVRLVIPHFGVVVVERVEDEGVVGLVGQRTNLTNLGLVNSYP